MKKLIEFLSEENQDTIVYVGTIRGSGWIVIDTAENLMKKLDDVNIQLIKEAERIVKNSQIKLDSLPISIVDTQKQIAECDDEKELKKLNKKLANLEKNYATAYNSRMLYKQTLNKWIPLKDRGIYKQHEHETDIIGTCVLVSGFEKGKYWLYEEQFKTKK